MVRFRSSYAADCSSPVAWPDETVGQVRFTGISVTRRVGEGCNSFPRLRVGLPFHQATRRPSPVAHHQSPLANHHCKAVPIRLTLQRG